MEEANTLESQGDLSGRKVAGPSAMKMGTFMGLVKVRVKVIKKLSSLGGILKTKKDDEKSHSASDPPILPANAVSSKTPRVVIEAGKDPKSHHAERNPKIECIDADGDVYITNENTEVSKPDNSNQSERSGGWHKMKKRYNNDDTNIEDNDDTNIDDSDDTSTDDSDDTSIDDSDNEHTIRFHPFRPLGKIEGQPRLDPQTNERRPYLAEEIFAIDSHGDANLIDISLVTDILKKPFKSCTPETPIISISGEKVIIIGKAVFRWQLDDPQGVAAFFRSWFLIARLPDPIPKVIIGYKTLARPRLARSTLVAKSLEPPLHVKAHKFPNITALFQFLKKS